MRRAVCNVVLAIAQDRQPPTVTPTDYARAERFLAPAVAGLVVGRQRRGELDGRRSLFVPHDARRRIDANDPRRSSEEDPDRLHGGLPSGTGSSHAGNVFRRPTACAVA
jgi:hypothetical protein